MLKLSSPITEVSGVGPAKAQALLKLGVTHIRDLLFAFPRRYEDFSQITPIKDLKVGSQLTVHGKVKSVTSRPGWQGRRRLLRIYVEIEDETGVLQVTWYNLRFLAKQLTIGREIFVAGKIEEYRGPKGHPTSPEASQERRWAMRSPAMEFADSAKERTHTGAITPIYPETRGVTSRFLRYQVKNLLPIVGSVPEYIPTDIVKRHKLLDIHNALRAIHFPKSIKELKSAQRRLRFDELFFLQLAALVRRQLAAQAHAPAINITGRKLEQLVKEIPFVLTSAQKKVLAEVVGDLKLSRPMNRLLQGDVGSGKSVIALLASQITLAAGYKVIYLAPTEILARQQAKLFASHLGEEKVRLLVGALPTAGKERIKKDLRLSEATCVVGTHALLQDDVKAQGVGLVVIDEQHRFGVSQRQALRQIQAGDEPHLLSMTATPIPRTLSLTVYGDLEVSVIDELPPGRQQIITKIIAPSQKDRAVIHTLELLHQGQQGYVIAPLIDQSDKLEVKSATAAQEEMRRLFPGVAVGLLHGQMNSADKEAVMRNFVAGAIQLLVSTAVVEVGVNVTNATVMIIEGAERFGLAQLHQFRGRIGRGEHQAYCYLFPTTQDSVQSERLQVLSNTTDGFVIAEEDLRLRGPGEVYGVAQSGFSDLKVASLLDYATIKLARSEAESLLAKDPELERHPILQAKVRQKNTVTHFE